MSSETTTLLEERVFLSSAGNETYLLFDQKYPLRDFCAFEVFENEAALSELEDRYFFRLLDAAQEAGLGMILDALIWRAHADFVAGLGYPVRDVARINSRAVSRTRESIAAWRKRTPGADIPVLVAGDIGPRGDGYQVADPDLTPTRAFDYHLAQMLSIRTHVDVAYALTMTTAAEAIGIARAAAECEVPVIVSPTVETDGRLPDGTKLGDFIRRVDDETDGSVLYFIVNCAHPSHLEPTLTAARAEGADWLARFKGFRANASRQSHAELDEATELDRGCPHELAQELAELQQTYDLRLVGGCCGTDAEHIARLGAALSFGGA